MTCRTSRFQDGGSFQLNPLVTTGRLRNLRKIVTNQIRWYKQIALELWTEVGKQLHKKGDEYAVDFLYSYVFGLGTFRFPFRAFLAYGLVSETYECLLRRYDVASCVMHFKVRIYLWYLILSSILIQPRYLNKGSDDDKGSASIISHTALFCSFKILFNPSLLQLPHTIQQ